MQRVLSVLFLALGILNLYQFVETFMRDVPGPFHFLFWETGLTGYRIKCLTFAAIFIFGFWSNYKKMKR